ncbi:MAG: hypothetical protein K0S38_684 [Candidatus Paceibacter sp.]|jgi:undecaprenyl-diphosphatase|nr:hypothetical protein [Candidatus Paceibacter sp.]
MAHRVSKHFFASAIIFFLIFFGLAIALSTAGAPAHTLVSVDNAIIAWIAPLRTSPLLAQSMVVITYLGNPEIIIALEIALLVFILLAHRKKIAILFLGGIVGGEILSLVFKHLLARNRPEEILFHVSRVGFAFPSGHALLGTIFYGSLGLFAAHLATKKLHKKLIVIATALIIFLVGFSRIYLGVHWFSDVVGGWALGLSVLSLIAVVFYTIHHHKTTETLRSVSKKEKTAIIVVSCMTLFYIVYFYVTHLSTIRSIV